jgi:hypothetical protein
MNRESVTALVARALDSYEYAPASDTLGTPWSAERVADEIRLLRESLVEPNQRLIRRHPPEVPTECEQQLWVVAITNDDFVLFFDEVLQEFGLAVQGGGGLPASIGVYGDLVGTFCSR